MNEMTERFYEFAGIRWRVRFPKAFTYQDDDILDTFAAEHDGSVDHTLVFEPVDRLSEPEGECVFCESNRQFYADGDVRIRYQDSAPDSHALAGLRIRREGKRSCIQIKNDYLCNGFTAKMILNAMEAEHVIVQKRGFLLHASFIKWRGEAILFTAPSGTGKSTQADLWCSCRGAELMNGDRAAVMLRNGRAYACGLPFCGSSGVSKNACLPLKAIVYLSQAPVTTVHRLNGLRAFSRVWEGCCVNVWDREDLQMCTDTVIETVGTVPVYRLACTPDETAVEALERAFTEME